MTYSTALNRWVNRPAFTLKAAGAETASTLGAWVDLGDVAAGEIDIAVTAASGGTRVVTDGVLNTDTSLVSATAAFTASDVGKPISGTGIPAATTIASRTNATTIVLSQASTATTTGVTVTIGSAQSLLVDIYGSPSGSTRTVADGVTNTDTSLVSATAAFVAADVGSNVSGVGIPANTRIVSVTNATTVVLSAATTASGTGVSVTIAVAFKLGTIGSTGWVPSAVTDPTVIGLIGNYRAVLPLPRYVQYRSRFAGVGQSFTYSVSLDASY